MLDARRIAHQVLVRVDKGGAFANRALDTAIEEAGRLDARDVALATELAYGTLRRQVELDHALKHFSRQPLDELDHETRALLRMGAYQLIHLRVPDRAAVHATVELAKEFNKGRAVKYINAVLRSLVRDRANVLVPPESVDPAGHLSITRSVPRWLAQSLIDWRGVAWAGDLLASLNEPAPFTVRTNVLRGDRAAAIEALRTATGIEAQPTRYSPAGLTVEGAKRPSEVLRPADGRWQAQDEAAQLVGFLCAPEPGWRVIDTCAAPGGKSCHLAELMGDRGHVDAVDVHAGKLRELAEGARRLGLESVHTHAADASLPFPFAPAEGWDLALVDAPCSGLGTIRRHPELKTRRTAEDVTRLAALQASILDNVAKVVKPGGVLVYSVCTFTREEGTQQVQQFLDRHPNYKRAPLPPGIDWSPLLDDNGDLEVVPHRHGTDAFFAARLVREE